MVDWALGKKILSFLTSNNFVILKVGNMISIKPLDSLGDR